MKQVNPLYLVLFLSLLLVFAVVKMQQAKEAQFEVKESLASATAMAEEITGLKSAWDDKASTRRELQRLLASSQLKDAGIEQKKSREGVQLTAASLDVGAATFLINKLLNGTYVIEKMKIRQLDGNTLSVDMEIKL